MNSKEVESKIKDVLKVVIGEDNNIDNITSNSNLGDYGINSISFIKLVVNIENNFGFEFEDEYLGVDKFPTLNTLIEYVQRRTGSADEAEHQSNSREDAQIDKKEMVSVRVPEGL